jgi:hypothetical protein
MNIWIYLLSICDNFEVVRIIACVSVAVFLLAAAMFASFMGEEVEDSKDWKRSKKARNSVAKLALWAAVVAFISVLMPTQEKVVRAYLMYEGSKVVNAENVDEAIGSFTKRVDRVINILESSTKNTKEK